ncbi:MAG: hypothetical protein FVQ79_04635 [Planctomycetes bacterium]|nr:hypothetical protein [Planctomycetota bacterium]
MGVRNKRNKPEKEVRDFVHDTWIGSVVAANVALLIYIMPKVGIDINYLVPGITACASLLFVFCYSGLKVKTGRAIQEMLNEAMQENEKKKGIGQLSVTEEETIRSKRLLEEQKRIVTFWRFTLIGTLLTVALLIGIEAYEHTTVDREMGERMNMLEQKVFELETLPSLMNDNEKAPAIPVRTTYDTLRQSGSEYEHN